MFFLGPRWTEGQVGGRPVLKKQTTLLERAWNRWKVHSEGPAPLVSALPGINHNFFGVPGPLVHAFVRTTTDRVYQRIRAPKNGTFDWHWSSSYCQL